MTSEGTNISSQDPTAEQRKKDHINMAFESDMASANLDERFYYEPILSGHPNELSTIGCSFLGKNFDAPIWVSSMTGGTAHASKINTNLARACNDFAMGMGLGSCRQLLYSDEHFKDFDVRRLIGDQALYANLGIAQVEELIHKNQWHLAEELIKKLQADGLIIHINPFQEWLQPEGDQISQAPIDTIKRVLDLTDAKIIVKEVGQGMGVQSLEALFKLPIEAVDFAANGGTNFSKLELMRSSDQKKEVFGKLANVGHSALEMVKMSNDIIDRLGSKLACKQVIVSGGVKDFLDGYYAMQVLNLPSIYGQASGFLKHALGDYETLFHYVESQIEGYKLAQAFLVAKK